MVGGTCELESKKKKIEKRECIEILSSSMITNLFGANIPPVRKESSLVMCKRSIVIVVAIEKKDWNEKKENIIAN